MKPYLLDGLVCLKQVCALHLKGLVNPRYALRFLVDWRASEIFINNV